MMKVLMICMATFGLIGAKVMVMLHFNASLVDSELVRQI